MTEPIKVPDDAALSHALNVADRYFAYVQGRSWSHPNGPEAARALAKLAMTVRENHRDLTRLHDMAHAAIGETGPDRDAFNMLQTQRVSEGATPVYPTQFLRMQLDSTRETLRFMARELTGLYSRLSLACTLAEEREDQRGLIHVDIVREAMKGAP